MLGRRLAVDARWPNRLVRVEFDLAAGRMRSYALRRRGPRSQPMLKELDHHIPKMSFQRVTGIIWHLSPVALSTDRDHLAPVSSFVPIAGHGRTALLVSESPPSRSRRRGAAPDRRGGRCGRVSPGPFPRSVRDPHISTRSPLPEAGIIRGSSRRRAHRGREAPVTSRAVILEKSHRFGAHPRERDRHREAIWTPMSLFTPHKFGWHRDSPDPRDLVPTDELVCSLLDRLEPPRAGRAPGRTGASTCRRPTTNATWPPARHWPA